MFGLVLLAQTIFWAIMRPSFLQTEDLATLKTAPGNIGYSRSEPQIAQKGLFWAYSGLKQPIMASFGLILAQKGLFWANIGESKPPYRDSRLGNLFTLGLFSLLELQMDLFSLFWPKRRPFTRVQERFQAWESQHGGSRYCWNKWINRMFCPERPLLGLFWPK